MRKANRNDKDTVVEILTASFKKDPHVNWLVAQSKKKKKLKTLVEYVFGESLERENIPLYLETANPRNVEIYKKKGFAIFHTMQFGSNTLYLLRR